MSRNSNASEDKNGSDKSGDIESSENSIDKGNDISSENTSKDTNENGGVSGKGNGKGKGKRSRRMKKKTVIILLSVFGAVLVAAAVFVALQWNNIIALKTYMTHSKDEIADKIIDNDQRIAGVLERTTPVKIRDLTDDEKKLMASNTLSIEDAIKLLLDDAVTIGDEPIAAGAASAAAHGSDASAVGPAGSASPNAATGTVGNATGEDASATGADAATNDTATNDAATNDADAGATTNDADADTDDADADAEARLAALVAEAFVLRAYYTNSLESMRASAVSEYSALNAEDRTQTTKMNIGMNYMNRAGALEGECDRRMDRLIAGIESELKQTGGDTSLIGEIKSCYAEEKSLKKAYYLSLYN